MGIEVVRESGGELWALCPGHLERTGKVDSHPSWSINESTYLHFCFSCGYSGSIQSLYQDILGDVPGDLAWELTKQSAISSVNREERYEPTNQGPIISEWTLRHFDALPDRMLERRHLQRISVEEFEVRWDKVTKCWVLPIRDLAGELMGFQFRQKGTVINHPEGVEKSKTLFGIHLFTDSDRITIVESPLDAVRFHGVGVAAVSSFGASVSDEQITLLSRNFRTVVLAMDNDKPGQAANRFLQGALRSRGCITMDFSYRGLAVKDPGDVSYDADLRKAWNESISLSPQGAQETP
jgi:DNA primase